MLNIYETIVFWFFHGNSKKYQNSKLTMIVSQSLEPSELLRHLVSAGSLQADRHGYIWSTCDYAVKLPLRGRKWVGQAGWLTGQNGYYWYRSKWVGSSSAKTPFGPKIDLGGF